MESIFIIAHSQSDVLESATSCSAHTSKIYVLNLFTHFVLISVDIRHHDDSHTQSYWSKSKINELASILLQGHTVLQIIIHFYCVCKYENKGQA